VEKTRVFHRILFNKNEMGKRNFFVASAKQPGHWCGSTYKAQKRTRHCEEGAARRGNPPDLPAAQLVQPSIQGIATPVCALVRNDMFFCYVAKQ
jgi:hypothetical protein